jgi:hypothetical protein
VLSNAYNKTHVLTLKSVTIGNLRRIEAENLKVCGCVGISSDCNEFEGIDSHMIKSQGYIWSEKRNCWHYITCQETFVSEYGDGSARCKSCQHEFNNELAKFQRERSILKSSGMSKFTNNSLLSRLGKAEKLEQKAKHCWII